MFAPWVTPVQLVQKLHSSAGLATTLWQLDPPLAQYVLWGSIAKVILSARLAIKVITAQVTTSELSALLELTEQ